MFNLDNLPIVIVVSLIVLAYLSFFSVIFAG